MYRYFSYTFRSSDLVKPFARRFFSTGRPFTANTVPFVVDPTLESTIRGKLAGVSLSDYPKALASRPDLVRDLFAQLNARATPDQNDYFRFSDTTGHLAYTQGVVLHPVPDVTKYMNDKRFPLQTGAHPVFRSVC